MNDCRYSHVFPGIRNGIVLSAQCPDENGDFQTSTQFFQIPPGPCKYNNWFDNLKKLFSDSFIFEQILSN